MIVWGCGALRAAAEWLSRRVRYVLRSIIRLRSPGVTAARLLAMVRANAKPLT